MSHVTRAITAATSVAAALGLPATDAIVLHNSNKLALRLVPCDVLARVAPVGQEVAQFEVELAQRLAEDGCPVGRLESRVDPLVYTREAACEYYPDVDQGLLQECRQLVLAMVAAWRWDLGDQFPNGRRLGEELLRVLREGPPWPTLDPARLDAL